MSGSTVGGIVGGVIGFFIGGPAGAQWGFMIGSAVGGYVDPVKVQGPRLQDAMKQTGQEGVPIPFGYGTFPTAGNIIWTDTVKEHKKKQKQGKGGGAETTTYTYTRSYAIGICEGPIAGLLMVKRNGKVVWDARDQPTLLEWMMGGQYNDHPVAAWVQIVARRRAWSGRFQNKVTFYLGDEEQLPDPTIEAVEGVGKVAAFRGLTYMVVKDDDVTDLQGAIPQYEFVVAATAASTGTGPEVGAYTGSVTLDADESSASALAAPAGVEYLAAPSLVEVGATFSIGTMPASLTGASAQPVTNAGDNTGILDKRLKPLAAKGSWVVATGSNEGDLVLTRGGHVVADLRPTLASLKSWYYSVYGAKMGYGADVGFHDGSAYVQVRARNGVTHNRIYRWPLSDAGATVVAATAESPTFGTDTDDVRLHVARDGAVWAFNNTTGQLFEFDASLTLKATTTPPYLAGCYAFGVADGMVFALKDTTTGSANRSLFVYRKGDGSLIKSIDVGTELGTETRNHRISVGGDSLVSQSGPLVRRFEYIGACLGSLPEGFDDLPDVPGFALSPSGDLVKIDCALPNTTLTPGTVAVGVAVADLCGRVGVSDDDIDVSDLTDLLLGYKVATESGADGMIAALMPAFFFDAAEFDGKLHFTRRGGNAAFSIGPDDLAERDGEAMTLERVQEAELLRKVTVGHIDPLSSYTTATQSWERRAGTVEAKGESAIEVPIVCSSTQAAQIAEKRGKVAWSETEKLTFSLPALRWSRLTPTDVGVYYDADGNAIRFRIGQIEEDSGVYLIEATRDRQAAYTGTATGVLPPPPIIVDPPLIGPARLAVMDLPVLRAQDDALGVYVAAAGVLPGWQGADVQISTDGGATSASVLEITTPATIGAVVAPVAPWISSEYPAAQTITVRLPSAPESIPAESLLRYGNRAAVRLASGEWEILQFQTVTANDDGTYTLAGLIRGRYATTPGSIPAGAPFVLLDTAVQFVPIEAWALGQPLKVRAVPFGTDPDATPWTDITLTGESQREWPVAFLQATRDDSDTVTVSWIPRPRIGVETAPLQSRFFAGYRVTFSDGFTADTSETSYARADTPAGLTVTVAALNSITGAGPSETTPT